MDANLHTPKGADLGSSILCVFIHKYRLLTLFLSFSLSSFSLNSVFHSSNLTQEQLSFVAVKPDPYNIQNSC